MYRTQMASEVLQRLKRNELFVIVDVREDDEWNAGHIPGAKHIPLKELPVRFGEIDPMKENIIVCHSGGRSAKACEFLAQAGYDVVNMLGGMSSWQGTLKYGQR